jgi:protein-S-isoprenylcysteine O-methyltransferase Ste14
MDLYPFISFLLLIFLISVKIIFLKRKGIRVGSGAGKSSWRTILLYVFFLLVLLVLLFEMVSPAFSPSFSVLPEMITKSLADSLILKISGVVVISVSLVLFTLALLHFNDSLRFGLDENNQGELVTSGIFMFSRNPFFLSINLYFTGLALLRPCLFLIFMAVLTIVSIHFYILKEEKFMCNFYGRKYENYKQKVRRYF